jgi:hypothetical protein
MKLVKTLVLAASAALMAMALVGAPSALAEPTGLCSTDASEASPCESVITHVHEVSVGKALLLTSILTVECTVLFLGDVTKEGSPLTIEGNYTYTNCGSCEATEKSGTHSNVQILKLGHELADVTYTGEEHIVCSGFIDCTYKGEGLTGHALGPLLSPEANGETVIKEQARTKVAGGFLCPKTAKLDITTTPLSATYIVGQMLCIIDNIGMFVEGSTINCLNLNVASGTHKLIS